MNQLQRFKRQVRNHLLFILAADNAFMIVSAWYAYVHKHFSVPQTMVLSSITGLVLSIGFTILSTSYLVRPLQAIWQAILHISPDTTEQNAPNLQKLPLGKDMVTNLVSHIYQLASVMDTVAATTKAEQSAPSHDFIATNLPLPLLILDKQDTVIFANQNALKYFEEEADDIVGKSVYSAVDMSFTNEHTFDKWLADAKANKPVAAQTWERVRINLPDHEQSELPLCDLAAYYNQGNPEGLETMLVFFDHTQQYGQDNQAMSFVALAVHELRTPLTLLRGYIEVFEEELHGKVTRELEGYMSKMAVAAQQLSTFTNTILNVSRIENDQFVLKLNKESWPGILKSTVADLQLRASVRGITLELTVASDLPPVGVDRTSIYEVISNLIDNAIKYSNGSDRIIVKSYLTHEGLVETTVQDFGVGIPEAAMPHLFEKFYRNQRSRAQIGGTGLGLYLAKSVVEAHGGTIWVRSKPGEGSTFGFTLLPYDQVADAQKTSNNESADIVRSAHGWIKNHSLYRR
jgi:signal transduction histidine kinase